jgi:hypothetical protein
MKKLLFIFSAFVVFLFLFSGVFRKEIQPAKNNLKTISENQYFELQEGDILVRPNWSWLQGSYPVQGGRKYGHVAIVTKSASGSTIYEALENAMVVEALFFDQATKTFQFKKEKQIREGKAIVSFGKKFTGIRYRLRIPLTEDQKRQIIRFSQAQLDGGYNILSLKRKNTKNEKFENCDWHCATIVWQAYYQATGIDIDVNGGLFIYPSDIIASPVFDQPGGIVRF